MSNINVVATRESIAFGPTESFIFPIPAGFVRQREGFADGEIKVSNAIRIDHIEDRDDLTLAGVVLHTGAVGYRLRVRPLIASDGIDGATGDYKNAVWGDWVTVLTAASAAPDRFHVLVTGLPSTQAIQVEMRNDVGTGAIIPVRPNYEVPLSEGMGVHVRVIHRS